MRVTIDVDSATQQEVYDLTLAFQRTSGIPLPRQITKEPVVTVGGSKMGWRSPAMAPEQARALLAEFDRLSRGVFGGPTADKMMLHSSGSDPHPVTTSCEADGCYHDPAPDVGGCMNHADLHAQRGDCIGFHLLHLD